MNTPRTRKFLAATIVALPLIACDGAGEPDDELDPRAWSDEEIFEELEGEPLEDSEATLERWAAVAWSDGDLEGVAAIEEMAPTGCLPPAAEADLACPDPDAPGVSYVDEDPVSCCSISILCLPGTELFDDACGCGCIATGGPTAFSS